ncbi:MAG: hypothetical protein AB7V27_13230 [Candidatus Binatia bacterium]
MKAIALALTSLVSLTLVGDDGTWQFGSWSRYDGIVIPMPPQDSREIRFESPIEATEYFRHLLPAS